MRSSIDAEPRASFERMRRPSGAKGGTSFGLGNAAGDAFTPRAGAAAGIATGEATVFSSFFFVFRLRNGATARVTVSHSARSSSESERRLLMTWGAGAVAGSLP